MKNILIIVSLLFLFSCGDRETTTYKKAQGQCGETWGDKFLDYEVGGGLAAAENRLNELGIKADDMTLDSLELLWVCVTCQDCNNGWFYVITTSSDNEDILLEQGFSAQ